MGLVGILRALGGGLRERADSARPGHTYGRERGSDRGCFPAVPALELRAKLSDVELRERRHRSEAI